MDGRTLVPRTRVGERRARRHRVELRSSTSAHAYNIQENRRDVRHVFNLQVFFVDFGNTLWVRENELRQMQERFLVLPFQAVECRLPLHTSSEWSPSAMCVTRSSSLVTVIQPYVPDSSSSVRR